MNTDKMDTSAIFEMFETINRKLDKRIEKPTEPVQPDTTVLSSVKEITERLENVIDEARKPTKVEYKHRHMVDIGSSKIFLSMVFMGFLILGLSYIVGEQRRNISQYEENDLKYRYVKMLGQTNEENIYRFERQFKYSDSIKIIRKQVEKYEELVKEQAERIERARRNSEEAERLRKEVETVKERK